MPPKSKPFTIRFVKDDETDSEYTCTKSREKYDNGSNDTPTKPKRDFDTAYIDTEADG